MDLNALLQITVQRGASDLHLSPGLFPLMRIQGDLNSLREYQPLTSDETKRLVYSVMDEQQKNRFEKELELDFAVQIPNLSGFRVNVFKQMNGIAAVFRVIPEKVPTLEQLNLPVLFKELLTLRNGLILVTGPTGSGKSTTLAAMVDYINRNRSVHVITIEDPIEFIHHSHKSLINQRQVHRDTLHFSNALRAALREDPDVILVGEMRDLETIRLALTAAETGHLVMATLHTSSAPRTISRIVDVFPGAEKNIIRNLLSESLQAVLCQTLVKTIAGGRTAAFEIMLGTPAIRNLIREDKVAQMYSAIQMGNTVGMRTFEQHVHELVNQNIISPDTAVSLMHPRARF